MEEKEKEKEREREKTNILKEEMDSNASKRRKLKREHPQSEPGEYLPAAPQSSPLSYDGRERGDRKGVIVQRPGYMEEPALRIHAKEAATKTTRRDADPYP